MKFHLHPNWRIRQAHTCQLHKGPIQEQCNERDPRLVRNILMFKSSLFINLKSPSSPPQNQFKRSKWMYNQLKWYYPLQTKKPSMLKSLSSQSRTWNQNRYWFQFKSQIAAKKSKRLTISTMRLNQYLPSSVNRRKKRFRMMTEMKSLTCENQTQSDYLGNNTVYMKSDLWKNFQRHELNNSNKSYRLWNFKHFSKVHSFLKISYFPQTVKVNPRVLGHWNI